MFHVLPVTMTTLDWNSYLTNAKAMLGRSITAGMDRQHAKQDLEGFLLTLKEFQSGKPAESLRGCGTVLRHVSVGFLCLMPPPVFYDLVMESGLAITVQDSPTGFKCCLVSGNLEQWKYAIINCSSEQQPNGLRGLTNKFMAYFEQAGLGPIWSDYSKTPMPDSTYRLTQK